MRRRLGRRRRRGRGHTIPATDRLDSTLDLQRDEWLVGRRYLSDESMRLVLDATLDEEKLEMEINNEEVIALTAA
jgi:hypothetical protein